MLEVKKDGGHFLINTGRDESHGMCSGIVKLSCETCKCETSFTVKLLLVSSEADLLSALIRKLVTN
jgi:hypothetical protein